MTTCRMGVVAGDGDWLTAACSVPRKAAVQMLNNAMALTHGLEVMLITPWV